MKPNLSLYVAAIFIGLIGVFAQAYAQTESDTGAGSSLIVEHFQESVIPARRNAIPGQYIVLFKDSAFSPEAARIPERAKGEVASLGRALTGRHGGSVERHWGHAVRGMSIRMNAQAASAMGKDPRVLLVEQDSIMYASELQSPVPSWGLDRIDQRSLPLSNSYIYDSRGSKVTAYIIDTGIRTTHNDFGGRAIWGTNTTGDNQNTDCNGHGTHVAGTVGGTTHGIAKDIDLVAVKVLDCTGSGSTSGVIAGIDWVIANKKLPAVVNMSLGGAYSSSLNLAVARAVTQGLSFVAAAGNENIDACQTSPASAPAAITVGASTNTDGRASFSNYGACLDIFAPGSDITSATHTSNSSTETWSGTSMAAPHVAGVAALYLDVNPGATPAEVATALTQNATAGTLLNIGANSPNLLLFSNVYSAPTPTLSVNRIGSGRIASTTAGIDCGTVCTASFAPNTTVTLKATPDNGYRFAGWSEGCQGTGDCILSMTSNRSVTATFIDEYGSSERFPASGVWPSGWTTPTSSSAVWTVVTQPVLEGQYGLRSGTVGHGKTSAIAVTGTFAAGTVSFDWTVSSEAGYDRLIFHVDGKQIVSISGCAAWSASCWNSYRHTLTAGVHTLQWSYVKDGSVTQGADAGWLDNVTLPAQTVAAPAAPSNLKAAVASKTQVNLTWTDNSSNESGFRIERRVGTSGQWLEIATVGANVKSYSNTGLTTNTTYYYRIRAYNSGGYSPYSNSVSAKPR